MDDSHKTKFLPKILLPSLSVTLLSLSTTRRDQLAPLKLFQTTAPASTWSGTRQASSSHLVKWQCRVLFPFPRQVHTTRAAAKNAEHFYAAFRSDVESKLTEGIFSLEHSTTSPIDQTFWNKFGEFFAFFNKKPSVRLLSHRVLR